MFEIGASAGVSVTFCAAGGQHERHRQGNKERQE